MALKVEVGPPFHLFVILEDGAPGFKRKSRLLMGFGLQRFLECRGLGSSLGV